MLDVLIRDARIIDGTGRPWTRGSVAVAERRIVGVGQVEGRAHRTILADDRVVAPGFIDMHAHSDLSVVTNRIQEMKIAQGVTTELVAPDGLGCAPVRPEARPRVEELVAGLVGRSPDWPWVSVSDYLSFLSGRCSTNVATLAPHATIRSDLLGGEDRPASESEIKAMAAVVDHAMQDGAFGLSTGLEYEPSTAASTEEIIALASVAARHGGFYVTHVRDYDTRFFEALEEAGEIARRSGAPLHYSHFHCYGRRNHGRSKMICDYAELLRSEGIDVSFDIYPYTAASTYAHYFTSHNPQQRTVSFLRQAVADAGSRAALIERINQQGSPIDIGWEDCYVGAGDQLIRASGRSIQEVADSRGTTAGHILVELVEKSNFDATIVSFMQDSDDVQYTVCHRLATLGSDAILTGERPHPRGWGAFAKLLRDYVVKLEVMTLEDAVCMLTGRAAARLNLHDRGTIRPGAWADLTLFDPTAVRDRASYESPRETAEGFDLVLVNGSAVWEAGAATGATPGLGLRKLGRSVVRDAEN